MVDDLHELQSPACHDVLEVVLAGIPRDSQVVASSRFEQPHVPRLRASGDALELLASDLALDVAGAEQIFSQAHVSLSAERAAAVTERTEGWPVGLHLAALIARDSPDEAVTISGDDRYVTDYLYRESLLRLPDSTQRFLRRTAILDQLCAPLCDVLLGEPVAQQQLRSIEASNLFLIPLDRHRQWYRYHALFREFLLGELRRVEPDLITKLHLQAADWYESNRSPAIALEHLLHTPERDRCVQLVTELALTTYQAGQMSTVQRWLAALGDAAIEGYPPLAVLAGWIMRLERPDCRSATVGGVPRRRLVRPRATRRHGVVRLGASDAAHDHVSGRSRTSDGRRSPCGQPRAAMERVARPGAVLVRRGPLAHGGRRSRRDLVRGGGHPGRQELQRRCARPQRIRARTAGDGWRAMGGRGRAPAPGTRRDRRAPHA